MAGFSDVPRVGSNVPAPVCRNAGVSAKSRKSPASELEVRDVEHPAVDANGADRGVGLEGGYDTAGGTISRKPHKLAAAAQREVVERGDGGLRLLLEPVEQASDAVEVAVTKVEAGVLAKVGVSGIAPAFRCLASGSVSTSSRR